MRAATLWLLAAAALLVAGCGGSAEQDEVAAAIAQASQEELIAYTGSVEMAVEGATDAKGSSAQTAAASAPGDITKLTFTGAADESDPAAPRSQIDMTLQGVNVRAIQPGDGNLYVVAPAGVFGAPLDDESAGGRGRVADVLAALQPTLSDFRAANDDRTVDGERLVTISATADANEFCDRVAPAFSGYMDTASANVSSVKGLTGDAPLDQVCRRLLSGDPTLWFGIDSKGMLRMIAMQARLSLLGTSALQMTLRFDVTSSGEPVSIVKPDGATMLGSPQELERRAAVPHGG